MAARLMASFSLRGVLGGAVEPDRHLRADGGLAVHHVVEGLRSTDGPPPGFKFTTRNAGQGKPGIS